MNITTKHLRRIIVELLNDKSAGAISVSDDSVNAVNAVNVNNVVDQSAAITNPANTKYKPQNSVELNVALNNLIKKTPDENASKIYDIINQGIEDLKKEKETAPKQNVSKPKSTTSTMSTSPTVEAKLRNVIRKLIKEKLNEDNGSSLEQIASELGMQVSGAKQFVDKAIARFKFLRNVQRLRGNSNKENPHYAPQLGVDKKTGHDYKNINDLEILILKAWSDYVDILKNIDSKEGEPEFTAEDFQFMLDHPEVALDLNGFREFLHSYIGKSLIPTDKDGGEWSGKDPITGNVRTPQNAPNHKANFDWIDDEKQLAKIKSKSLKKLEKSTTNTEDNE